MSVEWRNVIFQSENVCAQENILFIWKYRRFHLIAIRSAFALFIKFNK